MISFLLQSSSTTTWRTGSCIWILHFTWLRSRKFTHVRMKICSHLVYQCDIFWHDIRYDIVLIAFDLQERLKMIIFSCSIYFTIN